jgi:hypothetical protein
LKQPYLRHFSRTCGGDTSAISPIFTKILFNSGQGIATISFQLPIKVEWQSWVDEGVLSTPKPVRDSPVFLVNPVHPLFDKDFVFGHVELCGGMLRSEVFSMDLSLSFFVSWKDKALPDGVILNMKEVTCVAEKVLAGQIIL